LAEHPHAMDTIGGIAEWWRERIEHACMPTRCRALVRLADSDVLEMTERLHDPLYRLRDRVRHAGQQLVRCLRRTFSLM